MYNKQFPCIHKYYCGQCTLVFLANMIKNSTKTNTVPIRGYWSFKEKISVSQNSSILNKLKESNYFYSFRFADCRIYFYELFTVS